MCEEQIFERLDRIEACLQSLVSQRLVKEYYTTTEVAQVLDKAEFTVREWCRLSRIHAIKRDCGRGNSKEWLISHDELERVRNRGLLPRIVSGRYGARILPLVLGRQVSTLLGRALYLTPRQVFGDP